MAAIATFKLTGKKAFKDNLKILAEFGVRPQMVYDELFKACEPMIAQAKANVAPLSKRVLASVDVLRQQPASKPKKKSVLIYVDKQETMFDWRAGQTPTSPRVKRAPGELLEESFATMLELGTSKSWEHGAGIPAHYWFSKAVDATKAKVMANITQAVFIMAEMISKEFKPPSQTE